MDAAKTPPLPNLVAGEEASGLSDEIDPLTGQARCFPLAQGIRVTIHGNDFGFWHHPS